MLKLEQQPAQESPGEILFNYIIKHYLTNRLLKAHASSSEFLPASLFSFCFKLYVAKFLLTYVCVLGIILRYDGKISYYRVLPI